MHTQLRYHAYVSKQLTIRGVPSTVAERLETLSRLRGQSLNATVNEILVEAVGEDARRRRLERYATWTPADLTEFEDNVAAQRGIDASLWD